MASNFVVSLVHGVTERVAQRALEYWCKAEKDLGERVETAFAPDRCELLT
jgi:catalase